MDGNLVSCLKFLVSAWNQPSLFLRQSNQQQRIEESRNQPNRRTQK